MRISIKHDIILAKTASKRLIFRRIIYILGLYEKELEAKDENKYLLWRAGIA